MLRDSRQIDAQKQPASTRVTAITLATSQVIDNEVVLDPTTILGALTRKVRRISIVNRENARITVRLATQDAAGANDANLAKRFELTPYGNYAQESERADESVVSFLATANARRLSSYIETVNGADGGALPAGLGADIEIDYYDDMGA